MNEWMNLIRYLLATMLNSLHCSSNLWLSVVGSVAADQTTLFDLKVRKEGNLRWKKYGYGW
jgi:hypothetical protein